MDKKIFINLRSTQLLVYLDQLCHLSLPKATNLENFELLNLNYYTGANKNAIGKDQK